MKVVNRTRIANFCLLISAFLNPFGFDVVFYMILELTGSYGVTTGIFYLLSLSFLGLYLYLLKINPITHILSVFKTIKRLFVKNK